MPWRTRTSLPTTEKRTLFWSVGGVPSLICQFALNRVEVCSGRQRKEVFTYSLLLRINIDIIFASYLTGAFDAAQVA